MSDESGVVEKTVVVEKINPLIKKLNDRMPGQMFRLPSLGILYTDGELDSEVKDGEILVKPMTTLDDIYMKTPDMIFQGTALETVIKRCVPQVNKPLELFAHDVDYILMCLKKVSMGDFITIKHKCVKCETTAEYDLPIKHFMQNSKSFSVDNIKDLKLTLSNDFEIGLQPSRIGDMLKLLQVNDDSVANPEDLAEFVATNLCSNIKSVDGIEDRNMIKEWSMQLPKSIMSEFLDKIEAANNWGTNFEYDLICSNDKCKHKQKLNTSINPLFFFMQP